MRVINHRAWRHPLAVGPVDQWDLRFFGYEFYKFVKCEFQLAVEQMLIKSLRSLSWGYHNVASPQLKSRMPSRELYERVLREECERRQVAFCAAMSNSLDIVVSFARFAAWARLREMKYSYPGIARRAGRDHTTIIYGVRQVYAHIKARPRKRPLDGSEMRGIAS